jgi:hypothetical protein
MCRVRLCVNSFSLSGAICCVDVLMLCGFAVRAYRWMLQHPTLSRPAGVVVFYGKVRLDLIGVSISVDKDSSIFETQAKQQLRCL